MENITDITTRRNRDESYFTLNTPVPAHVFARMGSTSPIDPRVFFICPVCGPVRPMRVPQGYIRRQCKCERDLRYKIQNEENTAIEKERARAKTEARHEREASSDACYTWLGEDYSDYGMEALTFENYKPYTTHLHMIYQRMQSYADTLPNTLILSGPYGVGKTHLACAILNQRREQGKPGLFTTGANLFNAILAQGDDFEGKQRIITQMYRTPLLIIDDPDHATATDFRQGVYKEIFTKRCGRGLPTVITTNVIIKQDVMEMAHILGEAAASRLNYGMVVIGMKGEDYRKKQNARG